MTVVALAEAKIHPMIALLQSFMCHSWVASCSCKSQQFAAAAAAAEQLEAETVAQQLPLQAERSVLHEPQQKSHERQQLPAGQQQAEAEMAARQHSPCAVLHQDVSELITQHKQLEHEAVPQLIHQHYPQDALSRQHQAERIPAVLHCNEQTRQLPSRAPGQKDITSTWNLTSATRRDAQGTYLKLVVCAITLAALPFVAWLKQPMSMRQWAYWQDALPAAIVAMHASLLCLLVGTLAFGSVYVVIVSFELMVV